MSHLLAPLSSPSVAASVAASLSTLSSPAQALGVYFCKPASGPTALDRVWADSLPLARTLQQQGGHQLSDGEPPKTVQQESIPAPHVCSAPFAHTEPHSIWPGSPVYSEGDHTEDPALLTQWHRTRTDFEFAVRRGPLEFCSRS